MTMVDAPREGRVVLVAGGSRGIGLACARRFQADGARVVVTYRGEPPDTSGPGPTPILALRCDVTSPEDVETIFTTIEATFGPVEILVCSAGITDDGLLMRMSEERWARVIETNLTGTFRIAKRAIGPMIRGRFGRIVLISSVVAMSGNAGQTNYSASKAALIGFGRSLAREVASRGITVNIVAPGVVATAMLGELTEERLAQWTAQVPAGRLAEPEEIAGVIAFLAGEDAGYVTGAVVPIDGGLGMGH